MQALLAEVAEVRPVPVGWRGLELHVVTVAVEAEAGFGAAEAWAAVALIEQVAL